MALSIELFAIILVLIFAELMGIFIGHDLREAKVERKRTSFKFLKSKSEILRLDTKTGQVVLIKKQNEETEVHKGKRFPNSAGYFDLIENGNDNYVLYDTWTGYYTVLNENGDVPANWW